MTNRTAEASPLVYARVAGVAYLTIAIVAVLYATLVETQLIVSGNDTATANNILANESLFRVGIVLVLIIYVSVVVASWALYVILKTVHKNLALLALLLRSAEAVVGAATVLISFAVLYVLGGKGPSNAFDTELLQTLAGRFLDVRTAGLDIVLVFIGLGATIFCYPRMSTNGAKPAKVAIIGASGAYGTVLKGGCQASVAVRGALRETRRFCAHAIPSAGSSWESPLLDVCRSTVRFGFVRVKLGE